jgi:hypothetical protein
MSAEPEDMSTEPVGPEERLLWAIFHGPPCDECGMFVDCICPASGGAA